MPFAIDKVDNCPVGLFEPTNARAFTDREGNAIPAMTYHHIMSKERLKNFFDRVAELDDLDTDEMKGICKLFIAKHYAGRGGSTEAYPTAIAFQDNTGAATSKSQVEAALGKVLNGTYTTRAAANLGTAGVWGLFENFYFWWPANLHRGPSARLKPDEENYNAETDDGGENFEVAAKKVTDSKMYALIVSAEAKMSQYLENQLPAVGAPALSSTEKRRARDRRRGVLAALGEDLAKLLATGPKYTQPTEFDASKWKRERVSGHVGYIYRIK